MFRSPIRAYLLTLRVLIDCYCFSLVDKFSYYTIVMHTHTCSSGFTPIYILKPNSRWFRRLNSVTFRLWFLRYFKWLVGNPDYPSVNLFRIFVGYSDYPYFISLVRYLVWSVKDAYRAEKLHCIDNSLISWDNNCHVTLMGCPTHMCFR